MTHEQSLETIRPFMEKYENALDGLSIKDYLFIIGCKDWDMEVKEKYAELIVYGILDESLTKAVFPYRLRWDISSMMIQRADCEKTEREEAMAWLKQFHNKLDVTLSDK